MSGSRLNWDSARRREKATDGAGKSNLVDIAVEEIGVTDKAWRVTDGVTKVWVPKSQCELVAGVLTLPHWLAMDKGLI